MDSIIAALTDGVNADADDADLTFILMVVAGASAASCKKQPVALFTTVTPATAGVKLQRLTPVIGASLGMFETKEAPTGTTTGILLNGAVLKTTVLSVCANTAWGWLLTVNKLPSPVVWMPSLSTT
jgi:hypothetical protein